MVTRRLHAIAPNSSKASWWEWTQTVLLGANLVWTTLCLGGYRPETMVVTSALTCALLSVHCVARASSNAPLPPPLHRAGVWLLPFLIYAAINVVVVSPVPWLGWMDWLGWANLLAVFWVVLNGIHSSVTRRVLFVMLILLGIAAVILAGYQRFVRPGWLMLGRIQPEQFIGRASGPFGIPNSLAAYLLLLLPAVGALTFRPHAAAVERVWWGWVTLVFASGVLVTLSRGAWIGLALALVVWPIAATSLTWRRRMLLALAVFVAVAGVSATVFWASPKARERLTLLVRQSGELSRPILWQGAWNLFRDAPVTGTGAGSFNVLFERYRPGQFIDEPQWAHNDYLNTLSDYGAVGFALFFGVGILVAVKYRGNRQNGNSSYRVKVDWLEAPSTRGALGIGVLAFAFQLFVDFHFKIPALAMAFAATSALALGRDNQIRKELADPSSTSTQIRLRRFGWAAGAVTFAALLIPVVQFYRAESLRYRARQSIDAYNAKRAGDLTELLGRAEADLRRAVALNPRNATAWSDLAFALEMAVFVQPGEVRALAAAEEEAARRALAISTVVPEFWIRLGVALDLQFKSAEGGQAFERSLQLAPKQSRGWYYYAAHLARDTNKRTEALRAVATCLSLDPGNSTAEALKDKLTGRP
jgi:O-antigen ligase